MNAVTRFLKLSGTVALVACLGACASTRQAARELATPTNTTVDTKSAAAAEVTRMAAEPTTWPKFTDIPAAPTDVRAPLEWRKAVVSLTDAGAVVARNGAPDTFSLTGTDQFASGVRSGLDARGSTPPTAAEMADSAAFVKAAKARATPPPRPH